MIEGIAKTNEKHKVKYKMMDKRYTKRQTQYTQHTHHFHIRFFCRFGFRIEG